MSYLSIGFFGLIFFFVPMLLIKEAGAKNLALEKAKDELISSERLAAKGEMAAEVAHELNNYLAAISGRAHPPHEPGERGGERAAQGERADHLRAGEQHGSAREGAHGLLAQGAQEAAHPPQRRRAATVEFIVPQNKYERVAFDLDLAGDLPELNLDPAQIQQVLLNLFSNAADAMHGVEAKERRIVVHTRSKGARSSSWSRTPDRASRTRR